MSLELKVGPRQRSRSSTMSGGFGGKKQSKEEYMVVLIEEMEEKIEHFEKEARKREKSGLKMESKLIQLKEEKKKYKDMCRAFKNRIDNLEEEIQESKRSQVESSLVFEKVKQLERTVHEKEQSEKRLIENNRNLKQRNTIFREDLMDVKTQNERLQHQMIEIREQSEKQPQLFEIKVASIEEDKKKLTEEVETLGLEVEVLRKKVEEKAKVEKTLHEVRNEIERVREVAVVETQKREELETKMEGLFQPNFEKIQELLGVEVHRKLEEIQEAKTVLDMSISDLSRFKQNFNDCTQSIMEKIEIIKKEEDEQNMKNKKIMEEKIKQLEQQKTEQIMKNKKLVEEEYELKIKQQLEQQQKEEEEIEKKNKKNLELEYEEKIKQKLVEQERKHEVEHERVSEEWALKMKNELSQQLARLQKEHTSHQKKMKEEQENIRISELITQKEGYEKKIEEIEKKYNEMMQQKKEEYDDKWLSYQKDIDHLTKKQSETEEQNQLTLKKLRAESTEVFEELECEISSLKKKNKEYLISTLDLNNKCQQQIQNLEVELSEARKEIEKLKKERERILKESLLMARKIEDLEEEKKRDQKHEEIPVNIEQQPEEVIIEVSTGESTTTTTTTNGMKSAFEGFEQGSHIKNMEDLLPPDHPLLFLFALRDLTEDDSVEKDFEDLLANNEKFRIQQEQIYKNSHPNLIRLDRQIRTLIQSKNQDKEAKKQLRKMYVVQDYLERTQSLANGLRKLGWELRKSYVDHQKKKKEQKNKKKVLEKYVLDVAELCQRIDIEDAMKGIKEEDVEEWVEGKFEKMKNSVENMLKYC